MDKLKLFINEEYSKVDLTFEEKSKFQAQLLGDWERQQLVKGYTAATVALNLRNINEC
ncbi:hypothetical protein [Sporosarcina sp. BP05]|uniref:hypothetical protein n=1 Tax=Sporosarcina sp. BP05 TaxID=2758726 RepID=UPI0016448BE2|nr:hypothetical protein [Sporosarcina sp. BP05]